jgi:hypothetical protein
MLPSWVSSWCYQQMLRLDWKVFARYKHSSLFGLIISNKEKKVLYIDTLTYFQITISSTYLMVDLRFCQPIIANLP